MRPHRPQRHRQPEHRQLLTCHPPPPVALSPPAPGDALFVEMMRRCVWLLGSTKKMQRRLRLLGFETNMCAAENCTLHASILAAAQLCLRYTHGRAEGNAARLCHSGRRARCDPASKRLRSRRPWRPLPPTAPSPPVCGRTRTGRTPRPCAPATSPLKYRPVRVLGTGSAPRPLR